MSQKTVLHANVDGYEIITGFGEAATDPVATWAAIQPKVLALDELAQVNALKTKIAAQYAIAQAASAAATAALEKGAEKAATASQKQADAALAQAAALAEDLKPLAVAFEAARSRVFEAGQVYCTPGPGETAISDSAYEALKAAADAKGEREQVLLDGGTVPDYRGLVYWQKLSGSWISAAIAVLGQTPPAEAILAADLTEAQRSEIAAQIEAARVAALTPEARAEELAQALQAIVTEAARRKTEAEITGDKFDAQAWYAARKAELEKKYA